MSKDQKNICAFCKNWKAETMNFPDTHIEYVYGKCRLRAPTLIQMGGTSEGMCAETMWPSSRGGDWCGEYAERRDDHVAELPSTWQHISEPVAEVIRQSSEAYARNSKGEAA